jgi:hypothetical protein
MSATTTSDTLENNNQTTSSSAKPSAITIWPGSTEYRIRLSTKMRSELSGALSEEDATITVESARNRPVLMLPANRSRVSSTPVLLFEFLQPIDPHELVKRITFGIAGNLLTRKNNFCGADLVDPSSERAKPILQTLDEHLQRNRNDAAAAATAAALTTTVNWNCVLLIAPTKPLPVESTVHLKFDEFPSMAGPLLAHALRYDFYTEGAFTIVTEFDRHQTFLQDSTLTFEFSDALDVRSFNAATMVRCEPPLPNMKVRHNSQRTVYIETESDGKSLDNEEREYVVTFSGEIESVRRQRLQQDISYRLKLKPSQFACSIAAYVESSISKPILLHDPFVAHHQHHAPSFVVRTYNYRELRVCLYTVDPTHSDLRRWKSELQRGLYRYRDDKSDTVDYVGGSIGQKVYDEILPVKNFAVDQEVDFVVDLTPALLENGKDSDNPVLVGQVEG